MLPTKVCKRLAFEGMQTSHLPAKFGGANLDTVHLVGIPPKLQMNGCGWLWVVVGGGGWWWVVVGGGGWWWVVVGGGGWWWVVGAGRWALGAGR